MPNILTTSKLASCFARYATAIKAKQNPYKLEEQFDAATQACYEYTTTTKEFAKFLEAGSDPGDSQSDDGSSPMLIPSDSMELKKTQDYYLMKGFVDETNRQSNYHIRLENQEGELPDFHLTRDKALVAAKIASASRGDATKMEGRIFFKIEQKSISVGGSSHTLSLINIVPKHRVRGQRNSDQYSDTRLACFAKEAVIYMYYFMYMVKDI
jgi:hypothetical protein